MVSYRRMGNMALHLGNATSTISLHHLSVLWKSPRGTVLRIQALAIVAIIITFFLAAFGSCRRWSNRWIVQKGFFAAQALSLSLGSYSIGLMQSSSVKSEMYPIWTVSLFVLFGCIDPVTTYNGLDYKGPLSKMAYGICLNFGYVLLMSISANSSDISRTAIIMLSAISFIKGFHGSLALVQQSRMRNMVQILGWDSECYGQISALCNGSPHMFQKDMVIPTRINGNMGAFTLADIDDVVLREKEIELRSCYDACAALSLSLRLQEHFHGLGNRGSVKHSILNDRFPSIDYNSALKVIEIELAFLFDVCFTGNPFLQYYQAKTASLWALASLTGICFVGVAAAISVTRNNNNHRAAPGPGGCTNNVVDTTTGDLVITFVILVSLALLQLFQLIRCWTSNWARVAVACAYVRKEKQETRRPYWPPRWWLRLRATVATSTNWFDKYLWQEEIGQYSVLPEVTLTELKKQAEEQESHLWRSTSLVDRLYSRCVRLVRMLVLDYIWVVLWDLLGTDTNKKATIKLDADVKAAVMDFLGKINFDRMDENWLPKSEMKDFLPYSTDKDDRLGSLASRYTQCVLMWHYATWCCELAEQEQEKQQDSSCKVEECLSCRETGASNLKNAAAAVAGSGCFKRKKPAGGEREERRDRNRRVANALSKYCVYLVMSAPELLPGPVQSTRTAYNRFELQYKKVLLWAVSNPHALRERPNMSNIWKTLQLVKVLTGDILMDGGGTCDEDPDLRSDPWETVALMWVRILVYAAPYGNAEAHMRRLAQGGEFITHLWALLCHIGVREWKLLQNLHIIPNSFEAELTLMKNNGLTVVALLDSASGSASDELATVSTLKRDVTFHHTDDPDVADLLRIDPAKRPVLVLMDREYKTTLYDEEFSADAISKFLTEYESKARMKREQILYPKRRELLNVLEEMRLRELDKKTTFENPAKKQSSDDGGQTKDEIEEESWGTEIDQKRAGRSTEDIEEDEIEEESRETEIDEERAGRSTEDIEEDEIEEESWETEIDEERAGRSTENIEEEIPPLS